jgi:hypothetical protein
MLVCLLWLGQHTHNVLDPFRKLLLPKGFLGNSGEERLVVKSWAGARRSLQVLSGHGQAFGHDTTTEIAQ